jgi:glucokinase
LQCATQAALDHATKAGYDVTAVGLATAGWVDPSQGRVVYATDNLPGWTGAHIAESLGAVTDLPVFVENDANALAVGEHRFGSASSMDDFICITLGTGLGGGCYVNGRLNRGAHFFANALGHICIEPNGRSCTCGRLGCLEAYTNTAALLDFANGNYPDSETLISAANAGASQALAAIRTLARYLAAGCTIFLQLLDPEALILAGGMLQNNPFLIAGLEEELAKMAPNWEQRGLKISASNLGYHAGVLGAAAVALEAMEQT